MRALDRKLLRDLWRMRGQAIAVGVLVACAVAVFVSFLATERAMRNMADAFYAAQRLGDVFASARRVPRHVADRIAGLPGVMEVEARIVGAANVDRADAAEPTTVRLVSRDPGDGVTGVHLRVGRDIDPGARGEVLVSEGFALANGLGPGDSLALVVNGRWERVRIVGIALSPEWVIAVPPGGFLPDDRHFGIVWAGREALEAAFDMEGAFNDVALRLARGASEEDTIARVDELLAPYGGLGAYGRYEQLSARFVEDEQTQLRVTAIAIPAVFLAVAAYILAVATSRVVAAERPQIGMLKALGYRGADVAGHYAKMVALIALAGSVAGAALGDLMGRGLARDYQEFYRFPDLVYAPAPDIMVLAAALALAAALLGAAGAVRRAARLPPAEAMRPEPPASFRPSLPERLGLARLLSPVGRMALRNLARRPLRALLSTFGLATAVAVLVIGNFSMDGLDFMVELTFGRSQRQDATVTFTEPASRTAAQELRTIPGMLAVEPFRSVAVTLRSGHRSYRTALTGVPPDAELQRIVGVEGRVQPPPAAGLVISTQLARILRVAPGDEVRAEIMEGRRPVRALRIADTVEDVLGISATMPIAALDRIMGDQAISGAWITTDPARAEEAYESLRLRPRVAGVIQTKAAIEAFDRSIAELIVVYAFILVGFAAAIAAGVVYNAARVLFMERSHEVATLRVIGFTRAESFRVLLGEIGVELVAALPVGCVLGWVLSVALSAAFETDLYRIPVVIDPSTYAFAIGVTVAAAAVTALALRRWIARLDLLEALKSRE